MGQRGWESIGTTAGGRPCFLLLPYAYDAYFIDCAVRLSAPLLSLDGGLKRAALKFGVKIMEI
jgi:hypothetical protein